MTHVFDIFLTMQVFLGASSGLILLGVIVAIVKRCGVGH